MVKRKRKDNYFYFWIAIGILLIAVGILGIYKTNTAPVLLKSPTSGEYVTFPSSCTNAEVKTLWKSVFKQSVVPSKIKIDDSNNSCKFVAYKVEGDLSFSDFEDGNDGWKAQSIFSQNSKRVLGESKCGGILFGLHSWMLKEGGGSNPYLEQTFDFSDFSTVNLNMRVKATNVSSFDRLGVYCNGDFVGDISLFSLPTEMMTDDWRSVEFIIDPVSMRAPSTCIFNNRVKIKVEANFSSTSLSEGKVYLDCVNAEGIRAQGVGKEVWVLRGWKDSAKTPKIQVDAYNGIFSESIINQYIRFENLDNFLRQDFSIYSLMWRDLGTRDLTISAILDAHSRYKNTFEFSPAIIGDWNSHWTLFPIRQEIFSFTERDSYKGINGAITSVSDLQTFTYSEDDCIANWTKLQMPCVGDKVVTYYTDSHNCGHSIGLPSDNGTFVLYDCNQNGVIGELTDISTSLTLGMKINNVTYDPTKVYNTNSVVEFTEGSKTIVKFDWDFSTKVLNLKNITLKKQSSSDKYGYILVSGLEAIKTFYIDRVSTSYVVCITDGSITDVSGTSAECTYPEEYKLICPGINAGYSCVLDNKTLTISGLAHSSVIQIKVSGSSESSCTESWNCSEWSDKDNKCGTRTCTDLASCGTITLKPNVTKSCSTESECVYDEDCDSGYECVGGKCNAVSEESECEVDSDCDDGYYCDYGNCEIKPVEPKSYSWVWIALIVLGVLILIVVIAIVYQSKKNKPPVLNYNLRR